MEQKIDKKIALEFNYRPENVKEMQKTVFELVRQFSSILKISEDLV